MSAEALSALGLSIRVAAAATLLNALIGLVLAFARALGEFGATLMLAGNIPGKTTTVPLAIYTAVQTGEMGEAVALVLALTALSCLVLILAGRLGARAA